MIGALAQAQETDTYSHAWKSYRDGLELYDKEKYSAAIHAFEAAQEEVGDVTSSVYEESAYFRALCALQLFSRNGAYELKEFLRNYPESPRVKDTYFQLGKYAYRKKKWEDALEWFDQVDPYDLSTENRHEYFFRKGYAHFREGDRDAAKSAFYELINIPSYYHAPANYYYGHIQYEAGNYETALRSFRKIETDEKFAVIIPYYVTQIFYNQERYDSLIAYAKPLLEQPKIKRKPEIARLVGEAYFGKEDYADALPFLEQYTKESDRVERKDHFQLGYAYYAEEQYDKAIPTLKKVIYANDSLAQAANYLIGNAFVKTGDKKGALFAYQQAYPGDWNPDIAQEALFSFAKLSYELSYDPYNQALDAFILYLDTYPNALRKEQAYDYLINIYLNSRNYRAAIASLESTRSRDPRLQQVYQQLQYNLGVELFRNGQYAQAIDSWGRSLENPQDKALATRASYWKGEAHYQMQQYLSAIDAYTAFLFQPRAILLPEFYQAHYSAGYAYFQSKDYNQAASWFRKFITYKDADSARVTDALIRTGDCYFIQSQFLLALEYYQRAVDREGPDTDYALYQFALASGIQKKQEDKLASLKRLEEQHPNSDYLDAALHELGKTYVANNEPERALAYFQRVVNEHPNSSYKRKAQLSIGLVYYNRGDYPQALEVFKAVVKENPTYTDSKEAIRGIENIYIETGRIDQYEAYIASLDFLNLSNGTLDSLTYESAELQYMAGQCKKAAENFGKYLGKFEQPLFFLPANFYRAECLFKADNTADALVHFETVIDRPTSKFTEPSLEKASYIRYTMGDYERALKHFRKLDSVAEYPENKNRAIQGIMRSLFYLERYPEAETTAQNMLTREGWKDYERAEARYVIARSLDEQGMDSVALEAYRGLYSTSTTERAAEALYRTAAIQLENQAYDSAEATVFALVNFTPTYDQWLAKGLLLLADVYEAKGDSFQAKATLESIVANYEGEETIRQEAEQKLQALIEAEQPAPTEPEDVEIDLQLDSIDYELLFEEEEPVEEIWPE
ncbi:MAG: tetratricopeptide repeat protein [Leptolyngbya sp. SIO3F4]|nr:tetratricopeptide repeat protein [Leptolyngbya sp. SIO3F4]